MASLPFCCSNPNPISGAPLLHPVRASISQHVNTSILRSEDTKEKIKKLFNKVELSVSAYDTAWVAMVPTPDSASRAPHFPECLHWLLHNQLPNGSWGHHVPHDDYLTKEALSSTLASLLALKRWGVGERQITNGLQFIGSNISAVGDGKQHSPIGFDIIFGGMIQDAHDMGLKLPLKPTDIDAMLSRRDLELARGKMSETEGRRAYLAYVSEGIGKLQDWPEMVSKFQRKNGSLFNSPSATAAAVTHSAHQNAHCLDYLISLVHKHAAAVPAVYPLEVYARLLMVDTLVKLGIDHHFQTQVRTVLDETYGCWLMGEEEIFKDTTTCAMAFRMLRENGYEVSSDPLAQFGEENHFFNHTLEGYLEDKHAIVELYKASHIAIHHDEFYLEQLKSWTSRFLKHKSSTSVLTHANRLDKHIFHMMDDTLKFQYQANLQPLAFRTNIEHYDVESTRVLKTSYRSPNISHKLFREQAAEDFNSVQSVHRSEFEEFKRWVVEKRLDKLNLLWQKLDYCYFSAAATLYFPELSGARMAWAKTALLTALADDLFDSRGHEQDKINLVKMAERWDGNVEAAYLSEPFEIFYSALHSTVCEFGDKARILQERSVTSHLAETWLSTLKAMLREEEWKTGKAAPSLDEYMSNAYVSFAFQPTILSALYLLGPKLSEEVVRSPELALLDELMSTIGRLLNDIRGYKREAKEGKDNAVSLLVIERNGVITVEEAVKEIECIIDEKGRELLRLVLQKRGSSVPRASKKLFWLASRVFHLMYMKEDGFHSLNLVKSVQSFIHDPIVPKTL